MVTNDHMVESVLESSREVLSDADLQLLAKRIHGLFATCKTKIRYHRAADETALNLGIRAGRCALQKAQIDPAEIDLLLYVGVGRGFIEPATATVFQAALGLVHATSFDILDACASWLRALQIAHAFLAAGTYRNIMILNAEFNREWGNLCFKSISDLDHRFPALTIGEAATATIVSASASENPFYFSFRTWGEENMLCKIPLPHYREYSNGERLCTLAPLEFFSFGSALFRSAFTKLIEHHRHDPVLKNFKPDMTFGHAASDRMTERVATQLGLGAVYLTHARFGNTVSASIPLGMAEAIREGGLIPGMNVLLGCGSAGTTTGWACFRYCV
jgi:3-oxoacyl-[acyl-carrier-protein] synthase III